MDKQPQPFGATAADIVSDEISEAQKRLSTVLDSGKKMLGRVKEQVANSAAATDEAVHKHPYMAIGIAIGVGALIGALVTRRMSRHCG